jgi:hypothetical protein
MDQLVVAAPNQIADSPRDAKIEPAGHPEAEADAVTPLSGVESVGETAGFKTGEVGVDAETGKTAPQVRLHPLRPRKMLSVDQMKHADATAGLVRGGDRRNRSRGNRSGMRRVGSVRLHRV